MTLRLVGLPETNKVMAGEMSRLYRRASTGAGPQSHLPTPRKEGTGQLVYPFSEELAWVATNYHRTCSRVLWDLYESRADRLEPLYDELRAQVAVDRRAWCWDGARISVAAQNVASFAAGERQIVGTVKNALVDGCADRAMSLGVNPAEPELLIAVRMHDDRVRVSLDLAGGPMHRRGYRLDGGEAPLRENLAAVLVMLARHQAHREPLVDPMAGSGTIAIEAALMARAEPLWTSVRPPALVRVPAFSELAGRATPALFEDTEPVIVANELDPVNASRARQAIAAAGVGRFVELTEGDFSQTSMPPLAGVIVSNPPYGHRLGGDEVLPLYGRMWRWLEEQAGWRAAFLVGNPEFEAEIGLRARVKKPLSNGPIRSYFYLYDL